MYYPDELPLHSKYVWSFDDAPPFGKCSVKAYSQRITDLLPLHIHDFYELNIVLGGSGRHYIGQRNVPTEVGDVFVIPPDIAHGYFADTPLEILHILPSNGFLHRYSDTLSTLSGYKMLFEVEPVLRSSVESEFYLSLGERELKELNYRFSELLSENAKSDRDSDTRMSFTVLSVIGTLCEKMAATAIAEKDGMLDRHAVSVIKSIEYLENNIGQKISFRSLAADCGMSYSAYLRVFKRLTDTTPAEYKRECRIKKAEELLKYSDETVLSAALTLGYYDSAHFIREFEKYKGVSPTVFRDRYISRKA